MNRFKFRAYDNKNNEWLLGYELENLGGFSLFGECVLMGEWERAAYPFVMCKDGKEFDDLKVMQFSGLKDKNGTEIYEGDIIEWLDRNWKVHVETNHGIRFMYGSDQITKSVADNCEVVGNIYDNPELIKK